MKYLECKHDALEILKKHKGKYLLPYQIFIKLEDENEVLYKKILKEYKKKKPANPYMGKGTGIYYSSASYIAKALAYFKKTDLTLPIDMQIIEPSDLKIVDRECNLIVPGNKEGISLWTYLDN